MSNAEVLSDIKILQQKKKNRELLAAAGVQPTLKSTPLHYLHTGKSWDTNLPVTDVNNVFLLMDGTKGKYVIANGHIVYIDGEMQIQNVRRDFLMETKLIGWMKNEKAMTLLGSYE